jgi:hypothetical protein
MLRVSWVWSLTLSGRFLTGAVLMGRGTDDTESTRIPAAAASAGRRATHGLILRPPGRLFRLGGFLLQRIGRTALVASCHILNAAVDKFRRCRLLLGI